jgi:hypothetical protein
MVAKFLSEDGDMSPVSEELIKGVAIGAFAGESAHDFSLQENLIDYHSWNRDGEVM